MQLKDQLLNKINNKTKPIGALGMLEDIALQIALIQNTLSPQIKNPTIVVFAADHGIAATGLVNPYPQAVTAQMVLNFVSGGAAINVFCRQNNIALTVVDAGVNFDFEKSLAIIPAKIKKGTANYAEQNAMATVEVNIAIEKGKKITEQLFFKASQPVPGFEDCDCNTIGFGEMGIGNTSSASLIMSAVTGLPVQACVGRGTGTNDEQLKIKINTLQHVYERHNLKGLANEPIQLLEAVGGFEIAMMVGAYLKASELKMIIVVDGFIATAALLLAQKINNAVIDNCIFSHVSNEQGHIKMLDYLMVKPLLQLGISLGEGTGAALAIPLIQTAVNFLNEMASFETAGVSNKE